MQEQISDAQSRTWDALHQIASKISAGMSESEAIKIAQATLVSMGCRKFWHKCHIRFGKDTVLSFEDSYSDQVLGEDDIFYIDIGPIWNGFEGDAGKSFVTGKSADKKKCIEDVQNIFESTKKKFYQDKTSGLSLFEFAKEEAKNLGWILAPSYVKGHRLSEFPHSFFGKEKLFDLQTIPDSTSWVLEIHICDPSMRFGAFYEDIL